MKIAIINISRASALLACLLFTAAETYGHSRWNPDGLLKPRSRVSNVYPDDIKVGPCGNLPRSSSPAELEAGSTISVDFESTIYHQGVFRIAFSPENDQGFDQNVLINNIPDYQNQRYRSVEITLPETPCNECTLQLIQTMPDRQPPSNYFSCADIRLVSPTDETPAAPQNFTASAANNSVSLSWDDIDTKVVVFESESAAAPLPQIGQAFIAGDTLGEATVVAVTNDHAMTLEDRERGKTYHYFAFAVSESWVYSAPTQTQVALDASAPEDPSESKGGILSILVFSLLASLTAMHLIQRND